MPGDSDQDAAALAEATRVLRDNRAQLTQGQKDLILDQLARNLDAELVETRRRWEKGEQLDEEQKTAILDWLRPMINHSASTNRRLVLAAKKPAKADVKVKQRVSSSPSRKRIRYHGSDSSDHEDDTKYGLILYD